MSLYSSINKPIPLIFIFVSKIVVVLKPHKVFNVLVEVKISLYVLNLQLSKAFKNAFTLCHRCL